MNAWFSGKNKTWVAWVIPATAACLVITLAGWPFARPLAASDDGLVAPERAEIIAQSCAACHGTDGRLDTDIPAIAGKPQAVLAIQLLSFRRDEMPGATVMPRLTAGFTEAELEAVAEYFSNLNPDED